MSASYLVYGLRVGATAALPGLYFHHDSEALDVRIHMKEGWPFPSTFSPLCQALYISSENPVDGRPTLSAGVLPGGEHFGLFYADGVQFVLERCGREVWADWPENYTLEDACTYLLGPVMGFVLRLRGTVCLHASAVVVDDHAIALVGLPGAGKSTTAAAFTCCGFPVLSDDVVALTDVRGGQWLVQPGYPRVNLWPDSVRQLFGSEDALPRITPTWEKRYLPLGQNGHHFTSSAMPLRAIYILESRDKTLATPLIEEVSGEQAFMALVANTYVNYLLDQDMRRTEFDVLSRVVSGIPVRRVRAPEEPSAVFGLCETIAADAKRVTAVASANAA